MTRKQLSAFAPLGLFLLSTAVAPAQTPAPATKHRIAVLDFDYGTVRTTSAALFGTDVDIGNGVSVLLANKLANDGDYRVVERQQIAKVLNEQNFANSNRVDSTTASKIGKILGVDAVIVGSITEFGRDDHNTNLGGAGSSLGKYGFGKVGLSKSKAVVGISARLVDTNTAEILAAVEGKGESQRSGTNLGGGGGHWWDGGGGGIDMGSSNFGATIIGEATQSAVKQLVDGFDQKAATLPPPVAPVEPVVNKTGLIADVDGASLTLNVGSNVGVKVGDHFKVMRLGKEIKDPTTGAVLRRTKTEVGDLVISDVDAVSSVGKFTGTGPVKVGDAVEPQ